MSQLEPRIEAIRQKYDLSRDDFWQIKQNGQWVCKHSALEVVAFKAGVEFEQPQIIQADTAAGIAVMSVVGWMEYQDDQGEFKRRCSWATGECAPTNYQVTGRQPAYPWAMAEKRAKDRVILKLVGIHGLVYSEDEADDFKATVHQSEPSPPKPKQKTVAEKKALWANLMEEVKAEGAKGYKKIDAYMLNPDTKALVEELGDYKQQFLEEVRQVRGLTKAGEEISGQPVGKIMERVLPSFENLDTSPDPLEELIGSMDLQEKDIM